MGNQYQQTREVLLELVTNLNKNGGLANEDVAKLYFDLACDKIENIYTAETFGDLIDRLPSEDKGSDER